MKLGGAKCLLSGLLVAVTMSTVALSATHAPVFRYDEAAQGIYDGTTRIAKIPRWKIKRSDATFDEDVKLELVDHPWPETDRATNQDKVLRSLPLRRRAAGVDQQDNR